MKVYLVNEEVDLGYRCHGVFTSLKKAEEIRDKLQLYLAQERFASRVPPDDYRDWVRFDIGVHELDSEGHLVTQRKSTNKYLSIMEERT